MELNITVPHSRKFFKYILVRLMFLSIVVSALIMCIYLVTTTMWVSVVISLPLSVAMCLYTAMIIARRAKDLVDVPLGKMLEYTKVLKEASIVLIETAKNLDQKAQAMNDASDIPDNAAIFGAETNDNMDIK